MSSGSFFITIAMSVFAAKHIFPKEIEIMKKNFLSFERAHFVEHGLKPRDIKEGKFTTNEFNITESVLTSNHEKLKRSGGGRRSECISDDGRSGSSGDDTKTGNGKRTMMKSMSRLSAIMTG